MSQDLSVTHLILNADVVVQGVLTLLILLSLFSWAVIFAKWRFYRKTRSQADAFSKSFWGGSDMDTVLAAIPQQFPNSPLPTSSRPAIGSSCARRAIRRRRKR